MALITTVLPTFRRPQSLARAIRSVLDQSVTDFEVHVYDNASGDETARVARDIADRDRRVKYYCHPANIGAIENFRFSIARVATPYFNVLSDDDFLLPRFFERALAGLIRYREAMLFVGLLKHVNTCGKLIAIPLSGWHEGLYLPPEGAVQWVAKGDTWTSVIFRKEILQSIGNIDPEVDLEADLDLLLRALAQAPMVLVREICATFTIHDHSAMSTGSIVQLIEGMRRIESKFGAMGGIDAEAQKKLQHAIIPANASRLFRLMLKLALRGAQAEVDPAINELRDRFRLPMRAAALAMVASSSPIGTIARAVLNRLYNVRRSFRDFRAKRTDTGAAEIFAPLKTMLIEIK